jgi:hypothetical protein
MAHLECYRKGWEVLGKALPVAGTGGELLMM